MCDSRWFGSGVHDSELAAVGGCLQAPLYAPLLRLGVLGLLGGLGSHHHCPNGQIGGVDKPQGYKHAHQQWLTPGDYCSRIKFLRQQSNSRFVKESSQDVVFVKETSQSVTW